MPRHVFLVEASFVSETAMTHLFAFSNWTWKSWQAQKTVVIGLSL